MLVEHEPKKETSSGGAANNVAPPELGGIREAGSTNMALLTELLHAACRGSLLLLGRSRFCM